MKFSPNLKKILKISLMAVGGLALTLILCIGVMYLYLNTTSWHSTNVGYMEDGMGGEVFERSPFPQEVGLMEESTMLKGAPAGDDYELTTVDRKIQKGGSVNMKVEDLDESYDTVSGILGSYNGELTNSYESGEGNERYVSMTLKVESKYFEEIYAEIKEMDGEVIYASYNTDDVTMTYTDLESRLRNLEAAEEQLVTLLTSAEDVTETLAVYTELTGIRSQIEVIEGQLKYMDSQVDYSYLTVSLSLSDTGMSVTDDAWKPWGVAKIAFSSLISFGKGIVNILIWVVVFSPLVGIVVGTVLLVSKKKGKK
ncbi:DUF4349 domain-containing protein [bacterium]|nr:DUF4349 domain-containing protein [bacterium]